VRAAGQDLGVNLNDPTQSVQDLAEMLTEVTGLRAQELRGFRSILHQIIERRDGWYFTDHHVIPADDLHYHIEINRLNEMDWEEHLHNKGWYGAGSALDFARSLYGINRGTDE
jgi:nucleoside-diphosphate-sugar epimerase